MPGPRALCILATLGVLTTLAAWGPMAAGFDADAEADGWRRFEAFFAEHLATG